MRRSEATEHRARRQVERLGEEVARAQSVLGLSDRKLAQLAGVAPGTVHRVRVGEGGAQVNVLCAVADAVGLELRLVAYPAREPSLRDTGQLAVATALREVAHTSWHPALEVPAGDHGRSADLVFFGPAEILHVEIERMLVDLQLQYRSGLRKREALAAMHARPVRLVLAVEDTKRNRRVVGGHAALLREIFPAGSREVLRALRGAHVLGRDGLLWIRRRSIGR